MLNELSEKLKQAGLGTPPHYGTWHQGVEAEVLTPQSGEWKKGKVRMRVILEFCPDEPEEIKNDNVLQNNNSLDDIRQSIS
ncbi:MAG TPA: KGK domain-containing protein [Coleofasciculaceae cyanobacterium]